LPCDLPCDLIGDLPCDCLFGLCSKAFLGMNRQAEEKIGMLVVELKLRRRRAIFLHRPEDLRDACGTALGDLEFLEEIADAPVAVAAGDGLALAELGEADRAVGAGIVDRATSGLVSQTVQRGVQAPGWPLGCLRGGSGRRGNCSLRRRRGSRGEGIDRSPACRCRFRRSGRSDPGNRPVFRYPVTPAAFRFLPANFQKGSEEAANFKLGGLGF